MTIESVAPYVRFNETDISPSHYWDIGEYNGDLIFQDNDATKITIQNNTGNVGIGTSNPTTKFMVNGAINVSGGSSGGYRYPQWTFVGSHDSTESGTDSSFVDSGDDLPLDRKIALILWQDNDDETIPSTIKFACVHTYGKFYQKPCDRGSWVSCEVACAELPAYGYTSSDTVFILESSDYSCHLKLKGDGSVYYQDDSTDDDCAFAWFYR